MFYIQKQVTQIGTKFIAFYDDGKFRIKTSDDRFFRCPISAVHALIKDMESYERLKRAFEEGYYEEQEKLYEN